MRRLIQSCFSNPHELVGRRIMKRACEMKKEFAMFYVSLEQEQRDDIEENMKLMLKKVVTNIDFVDEIQRLAEEFGQRFVALRPLGFRPDLFPVIADATIKECTHLDSAVHKAHTTTHAFSQFGALVFASVREGFYTEVRRLRRASASFSTGSNGSARRKLIESSFINENGSIKSRGNSPRQPHSRCQSRSASPDSSGSDELCPNTPTVGGAPATYLKPPTNAMVATRSY
ncbi:hypothetical protein WR25_12050 [Diploscapter pachys]|uniref:Uncharacterized protein n=1 Tax=Diploscapter pachys TaxID=2018661 RepID=A0A2A2LMA5_9BILA|nr:hypothetical protein WR25_12050 [Diploscapter pachys]